MPNYRHYCKDWDFLEIDEDDPEFSCCTCEIDSDGDGPRFLPGERVFVLPNNMEATVIKQILHFDGGDSFWGNLKLKYDDGIEGISHQWQVRKLFNSK